MKNIAIITQFFYPSYASTAQLMSDLAIGFAQHDYKVQVFTSVQNTDDSPQKTNAYIDYLEITRSFSFPLKNHSIISKIINSFFFLIQGIFYLKKLDKTTALLITSNPPYAGIIGLLFKFIKKGKYYFLLQDIFPESAVLSKIITPNSIVFNFFSKLIYYICLHSEQTIVLSEPMKIFLEQKNLELKEKHNIKVIENWAIETVAPIDKEKNFFALKYKLEKKFTVLYSGNIGRLHDIESIAEAIKFLKTSPIQFIFIGDGAKKKVLENYQKEKVLSNLILLPFQARDLLSTSLTACDVSLVSLVAGAEKIIAPCKLYGMLASGRAIVSISEPNSYIDKLLKDFDCGINCPPEQPEKLAQILMDLANNPQQVKTMGEKARQLYEEKYTFARAFREYQQLLFKNF